MRTAILATLLSATTGGCLALLVHTARIRARLTHALHEAHHDPLTGLPNRRALLRHLDTLLADPTRPVSVAMLDLDQFKHINDAHGHAAGDTVLRHVAATLTALDLPHAYLGRLSGDEFLIITDGTTQAGYDNTRAAVDALHATTVTLPGHTLRCQVSAGTATTDHHDRSAQDLLRRADAAMYDAKRLGDDIRQWQPNTDHLPAFRTTRRRRRYR